MSDPSSLHSLHYLKEISDHKIMLASFSFTFPENKPTPKQIKLYGRGNYEKINSELEQFFISYEQGFNQRTIKIIGSC